MVIPLLVLMGLALVGIMLSTAGLIQERRRTDGARWLHEASFDGEQFREAVSRHAA